MTTIDGGARANRWKAASHGTDRDCDRHQADPGNDLLIPTRHIVAHHRSGRDCLESKATSDRSNGQW